MVNLKQEKYRDSSSITTVNNCSNAYIIMPLAVKRYLQIKLLYWRDSVHF